MEKVLYCFYKIILKNVREFEASHPCLHSLILLYLRGSSFFDMLGIVVVVLRTDQSFSCDKPLVESPRCTWEVMGSNPTGDLNLKHLSYLS